jgi:hypothetical protein
MFQVQLEDLSHLSCLGVTVKQFPFPGFAFWLKLRGSWMTRVTDGLRSWRRRTPSCGGGLRSWNISSRRFCSGANARRPSVRGGRGRRRIADARSIVDIPACFGQTRLPERRSSSTKCIRRSAGIAAAAIWIHDRFDDLLLGCRSRHPQCLRIWRRLFRHCGELFTFLDNPQVPADNNGCERDIRSLAAARSDGGTHRADWSAAAFARIKSVIVTSLKNGLRFIHYGLETVRATLQTQPLPLPLADHN